MLCQLVITKMSQPIRCRGGHLVFPITLKNTNFVEDVEFLLPVKFQQILYSSFREEVKNVSANHNLTNGRTTDGRRCDHNSALEPSAVAKLSLYTEFGNGKITGTSPRWLVQLKDAKISLLFYISEDCRMTAINLSYFSSIGCNIQLKVYTY